MVQMHSNYSNSPHMDNMDNMDVAAILKNRAQGHRDSTYAMLLQLVATDRLSECLDALQQMVPTPRIGCWRDVRGFIRRFEEHGEPCKAAALIGGCVRMTNARIRLDYVCAVPSWAAKWVPREPKCRGSLLLQWYYDALADDMFPGAPDAKRRYRKLIVQLTPPETEPLGLARLVKRALNLNLNLNAATNRDHLNAVWRVFKQKHQPQQHQHQHYQPVLSLAHSMGAGHNNCLHAGIGLALLLSPHGRMITFSSHAQWHQMKDPDDFVSNAQHLFQTARSPTNGLNANLGDVLKLAPGEPLLVISDMEHDGLSNGLSDDLSNKIVFWNVSYNCGGDHKMNALDAPIVCGPQHYF